MAGSNRRPILEPSAEPGGAVWLASRPIPDPVRKLGKCPDLQQILPGDVLLISPVKFGLKARTIQGVQKSKGAEAMHAEWVHAALFLGSGFAMCEAVNPQVRVSALFDRLGSDKVLVRRVPDLSASDRWEIVKEALWYLAAGYDFKLLWRWWRKDRVPPQAEEWATICSELCVRAILRATHHAPFAGPDQLVTPALLSATDRLQDVPVGWLKLA